MDILESEKTILFTYATYGNGKKKGKVLKLPKQIIFVNDTKDNVSQLSITPRNNDDLKFLSDHKFSMVFFNLTNDPYAEPLSPVGNLGYHTVRIGTSRGNQFIEGKTWYYVTEDNQDTMMDMNVPLKNVNEMLDKPEWLFEYHKSENMYEVFDIKFQENMQQNIAVKHMFWDYKQNKGIFLHYITNLQSILNGTTRKETKEFSSKDELINYYQSNR